MYKMADILEAEGDPYGSTICYLKVCLHSYSFVSLLFVFLFCFVSLFSFIPFSPFLSFLFFLSLLLSYPLFQALDLQKIHRSTNPSPLLNNLPSPSLLPPPLLSSLPQDVLTLLFSHFPGHFLLSLARVCKKWKEVTSEEWIWKRIINERWSLLRSYTLPPIPSIPSATKERRKKKGRGEQEDAKREGEATWRRCFVEQSTRKLPVILLETFTKTLAGFAGDALPTHFKPSTYHPLSSYHYNVVGHSMRYVTQERNKERK